MKGWFILSCAVAFSLSLQGFVLKEERANDPAFLEEFKSDPFLGSFFEPVTVKQGGLYLTELSYSAPELLYQMNLFKENDLIGRPNTGFYKGYGRISPTTLRWINTAFELKRYFGDLQGYRILHLGAGYGGLCKILSDMGTDAEWTIVQEKGCNALCKQYLDRFGIQNVHYAAFADLDHLSSFDLVIIDNDFVTEAVDFHQLMQQIPRGLLLKKGVPDQFNGYVKTLRAAGCKGKLKGELVSELNIHHFLFWKPFGEVLPTQWTAEVPQISPSKALQKGDALANEVTAGRLGDQLLAFASAYWVSRTEGLPFLMRSFPLSSRFHLSTLFPEVDKSYQFKNKMKLQPKDKKFTAKGSTLWMMPFLPYSIQETRESWRRYRDLSRIEWQDPEFAAWLQSVLQSVEPIETVVPPEGHFSIALHVRRGGSFKQDKGQEKIVPLKFASDDFMIKQIKRVAAILPQTPFYIYLFTDDLSPQSIIEKYAQLLPGIDIIWDYGKNSHLSGEDQILSDFFSFQNFDALIRPCSHFSLMGGKLGNYKLEIGPTYCHFNELKEPVYDQIELFFNP